MQQKDNDGLIPCSAFVLYRSNQGLFFLIIKMTWWDDFLAYQFHDLCWIIDELSRSSEPGEISLEANEGTVNGVWLVLPCLEIGSVVSECRRGHGFRGECLR